MSLACDFPNRFAYRKWGFKEPTAKAWGQDWGALYLYKCNTDGRMNGIQRGGNERFYCIMLSR